MNYCSPCINSLIGLCKLIKKKYHTIESCKVFFSSNIKAEDQILNFHPKAKFMELVGSGLKAGGANACWAAVVFVARRTSSEEASVAPDLIYCAGRILIHCSRNFTTQRRLFIADQVATFKIAQITARLSSACTGTGASRVKVIKWRRFIETINRAKKLLQERRNVITHREKRLILIWTLCARSRFVVLRLLLQQIGVFDACSHEGARFFALFPNFSLYSLDTEES